MRECMTAIRFKRCSSAAYLVLVAIIALPVMGALRPAAAAELAPRDLAMLDRLTWGISASSAAHLQQVGVERWLQEQLHPPAMTTLPEAARAQIEAMPDVHSFPFDIAVAFDQQGNPQPGHRSRAEEGGAAGLSAGHERSRQAGCGPHHPARALSPDQLRERLTWFWFNHFNVHQYKANIRVLVGDYEDRAIRPFALGRFRDLLSATLHHPAMLRYLDNADNAAGHLNENYAARSWSCTPWASAPAMRRPTSRRWPGS